MPLNYKVVGKKHPSQPDAAIKYYAQTVLKGEIGLQELCNEIGQLCSVKKADIMTVLTSLTTVVPHKLAEGYIVRMGDLGNLRPSLNSEGHDTVKEVTSRSIKKHKVGFRSGKGIKKVLKTIDYKKA